MREVLEGLKHIREGLGLIQYRLESIEDSIGEEMTEFLRMAFRVLETSTGVKIFFFESVRDESSLRSMLVIAAS